MMDVSIHSNSDHLKQNTSKLVVVLNFRKFSNFKQKISPYNGHIFALLGSESPIKVHWKGCYICAFSTECFTDLLLDKKKCYSHPPWSVTTKDVYLQFLKNIFHVPLNTPAILWISPYVCLMVRSLYIMRHSLHKSQTVSMTEWETSFKSSFLSRHKQWCPVQLFT